MSNHSSADRSLRTASESRMVAMDQKKTVYIHIDVLTGLTVDVLAVGSLTQLEDIYVNTMIKLVKTHSSHYK
jgi:glycerol-3-phosphate responsive antiterminator